MPAPRIDDEAVDHQDYEKSNGRRTSGSSLTLSGVENGGTEHKEDSDAVRARQPSVSALLRNPLAGLSEDEVLRDVDVFVDEKGLGQHRDAFRKGALIARVNQRSNGFESVSALTESDKDLLRHEISHRWDQPFMLYFLVVLCAGSAIVQGMDQTAVNGAQVGQSLLSSFSHFRHHLSWAQNSPVCLVIPIALSPYA